jgi:hypothetical protein
MNHVQACHYSYISAKHTHVMLLKRSEVQEQAQFAATVGLPSGVPSGSSADAAKGPPSEANEGKSDSEKRREVIYWVAGAACFLAVCMIAVAVCVVCRRRRSRKHTAPHEEDTDIVRSQPRS